MKLLHLGADLGDLPAGYYLLLERTPFQAHVCRAGEDEDGMICTTEERHWVPLPELRTFRAVREVRGREAG